MTTLEEALYTKLTGTTAITDLVSTRVYPIQLPQDPTIPAIVYQRVDTPRTHAYTGPTGLARPRFQFDCIGTSYSQAKTLGNTLRQTLDGLRDTISGVWIQGVMSLNEVDFFDPAVDMYRISIDFMILYEE